MPIFLAASMTSVPFSAVVCFPSIVSVTRSAMDPLS